MANYLESWTVQHSRELFGIDYWGGDYFAIDEKGDVTVSLKAGQKTWQVSLKKIAEQVKTRGLAYPVMLRFKDLLKHRIQRLHQGFQKAIKELDYKNDYRGVFPVKVNQQQQVIEYITNFGKEHHHGLEAGSKAELIAALAYMHDPKAYIICNGYKDQEFIDLALYSNQIGLQTILVAERPGEILEIIKRGKELGIRPRIGLRVKLSSRAGGLWSESGGDGSVFGLTSGQIMDAVQTLKEHDYLDCLELLHYHLGSQIPNIRNIRAGILEASRFYVELVKLGAPMKVLDVGGGLAVDYDGSKTNFSSSKNYSLEEYCTDIIEVVKEVVDQAGVAHPLIISESGRATVAHCSVLLFNVLDVNRLDHSPVPESIDPEYHSHVQDLFAILHDLKAKNAQEFYHDAMYYRDQIRQLFLHGNLSLAERGMAEQLFWHIIRKMALITPGLKYVPEELQQLDKVLADVYYGNFSIFQSLPDSWAINQLFPIMPIHRNDEQPLNAAIIADTTCDSDGKIKKFIDLHDVRNSIPLHSLRSGEDYVLGAFMVGAYQETLGDLHNLFGDTNVVSVALNEEGDIVFENEVIGDTVADVLSYVEYEPKKVRNRLRDLAARAIKNGLLDSEQGKKVMDSFEIGLNGYTYYEQG